MSLADIKDQHVALQFLRSVIRRGRIPNALLFWGPSGVGKRTTALEFAKALNCRESGDDACDACLSCRRIEHGNHPDVRLFTPAGKAREIKKRDVDEINELAALRPFEAAWRLIIIEDADRINIRAQNHFLKTLEEPPGRTLFILLTQYPRVLFPTIRSRCQIVRFRSLSPDTVVALLKEHRELPEDVARSIAGVAEGQMGRAFDLVDSQRRDIVFDFVQRLAGGGEPVRLAEDFAKHLSERRAQIEAELDATPVSDEAADAAPEDLERLQEQQAAQLNALIRNDILEYLYLLETWYRDELVCGALGDTRRAWNHDRAGSLQNKVSSDPAAKILAVEKARTYLDRHVNEERVFRDLFFALAEP
ncbi:MAG: DNA polymerase III subunit delta' [Candidatus Hydrogenedentes bacterium]|nr:DNA polymerase III subunit delta' [Candidatus Hydrogenedentota bacterium]